MADKLLGLVKLQGDMRVKLLELGVPEEDALNISGEILHLVATSEVVTPETSAVFAEYLEEDSEQDSD